MRALNASIHAAFLHVSFQHLLANLLLFAVLGGMLECRYGTLRMLVVAVLSTLGAAFFAGAFADQCTQARECHRRAKVVLC
jgi:membrane associated rhomboid family serine protease